MYEYKSLRGPHIKTERAELYHLPVSGSQGYLNLGCPALRILQLEAIFALTFYHHFALTHYVQRQTMTLLSYHRIETSKVKFRVHAINAT